MFHRIEKNIFARVVAFLEGHYSLSVPNVLEEPRQPSFGELSITAPFHLARQLKRAPASIAREIVADIGSIEGVAALEVAGNGYINVRLDRGAYGYAVLHAANKTGEPVPGKIIVEHTNINPNKAAHIGHLRNAVLGDTFVRMLRANGRTVEVQNYIDNTGVQVADVVAGFHFLRKMSYDDVVALIESTRFDYYCWDLYAEVSSHPELKEWRQVTLHAIEHREGELVQPGIEGQRGNRRLPPRHHGQAGRRLRLASARERRRVAQILGDGLRAIEGAQGHLLRNRRQEQRLLGDAGERFQGADRRGHRRQQSDRALE